MDDVRMRLENGDQLCLSKPTTTSNARAGEQKGQTSKGRSFQLASRLTTHLAPSALLAKQAAAHARPCFWVHTARGNIDVRHWGSTP